MNYSLGDHIAELVAIFIPDLCFNFSMINILYRSINMSYHIVGSVLRLLKTPPGYSKTFAL